MNRESLPLILGLLVPIIFVLVVMLYYNGIDPTLFLRKFPLIYYIIMTPIVLGFLIAIIKWLRPD
ncbi:MAG: hypothetical protein ACQXXF_00870 [Thermoplasmatota archaeon]